MYCVEIDNKKTLIITNAIEVKIIGSMNEQIIFLDVAGDIVAFFKMSEIKGFYKTES